MLNLISFLLFVSLVINVWLVVRLYKNGQKTKKIQNKLIGLPTVSGFFPTGDRSIDQAKAHVFAHRGLASYAFENTGPAIILAASANVKALEIDVRFTKDLIPILWHDSRITDNSGNIRKVSDLNFQQIRDFTVFPAVKLLSLADFCTHLAQSFDYVMIDLKDYKNMDKVKIENSLKSLITTIPDGLKKIFLFDTINENAALMILESNLNACIRKPKKNVAKYYEQGFRFFMITILYAQKYITEKEWNDYNYIVNCREKADDALWAIEQGAWGVITDQSEIVCQQSASVLSSKD